MLKKHPPLYWLCYSVVFATGVMLLCVYFLSSAASVSLDNEELTNVDLAWSHEVAGQSIPITLPYRDTSVKADEVSVFRGRLPADLHNTSIMFFTAHQSISIFTEQGLLYRHDREGIPQFLKSPGSFWHIIRIPDSIAGQTLTVELSCAYDSYAGLFSEVYTGTKSALIYHIIRAHGNNFLLSLLILLLGICLTAVYFVVRLRMKISAQILYLGLFSVSIAGWLLGESRMLQILWGNPVVLHFMIYVPLLQVGFWFLLFIWELCGSPRNRIFQALFVFDGASILGQLCVQLFFGRDLAQMLPLTHATLILSSVYALIYVLWSAYQGNVNARQLLMPTALLFGFAVVEITQYYRNKYMEATTYLQFGLFLFLFIMGINQLLKIRQSLHQAQETQYFEKLAYTDFLTQLNNRTAYEKALANVCSNGTLGQLCVVSFDLNNLKMINDHHGHAAGDDALCVLAGYMRETVGKLGELYRTGGDEFMCLCQGVSMTALQQRLSRLEQKLSSHKSRLGYRLRVAYGYARFDPKCDKDLHSLLERADKNMYIVKAQMKSEDPVQQS